MTTHTPLISKWYDWCEPGRPSWLQVVARPTAAALQITQNKTGCLSFRDNGAGWQRSSKATITELFSAARGAADKRRWLFSFGRVCSAAV